MRWKLHPDVSYCCLDDRLIFLDIRRDRYFRLSAPLERNFQRFLAAGEGDDLDVSGLIRQGVLAPSTHETVAKSAQPIGAAARSAIEGASRARHFGFADVLGVFACVVSTRMQLGVRTLGAILDAMITRRDARAASTSKTASGTTKQLEEAAAAFRSVRRYVPIDTCCLLDSISLVRYLARRGFRTQIVFGVACDPFSAHCWVQAGDVVLNDSLGSTQAHSPIRVI